MIAWVLNLDADLELAAGERYSPSKGVLAAMEPHRVRLAGTLVGEGDIVLDVNASTAEAQAAAGSGTAGRAFCPTPRAIALMRRAGVEPEPHPSFAIVRRVNARAFSAELGQTLEGATFVTSLDEALRVLASPPPIGRQWRAKRNFGMAGRAQRPIAVVSEADVAYLRASIDREGGIQLEPEVDIVRELAMHGALASSGALRIGAVVEQRCDAAGQWLESIPAHEDNPTLRAEVERVAEALHGAGYFGPFGIDAFEYRAFGELRFNARSEINARYSMGYPASGLLARGR